MERCTGRTKRKKSDECPAGGGASFAATRIRNGILRLLGSGIDQHCHSCISLPQVEYHISIAEENDFRTTASSSLICLISRSAFWIVCDSLTGVGFRHRAHARCHDCGSLSCRSARSMTFKAIRQRLILRLQKDLQQD